MGTRSIASLSRAAMMKKGKFFLDIFDPRYITTHEIIESDYSMRLVSGAVILGILKFD